MARKVVEYFFEKISCAEQRCCYFGLVLGGTEARCSYRCDGLQLLPGAWFSKFATEDFIGLDRIEFGLYFQIAIKPSKKIRFIKNDLEGFYVAVEYFLKKYLVPSRGVVTLTSFWGEQKPVVAIAATGFNFYGVRGFPSFRRRISSRK